MVINKVNNMINRMINSMQCYFIAFIGVIAVITSNTVWSVNQQEDNSLPFNPECGVNITLKKTPKITKLTTALNKQASLFSKSYISVQVTKGARIATNVSCQKLTKAKYTASEQEWQNILKTNFQQLAKKGFKEVTLTPLVADNSFFEGQEKSREYYMEASRGSGSQVFYLANILNNTDDTLYTIMISGDVSVTADVKAEYQRVLLSLGALE
jgi:hypothetical protein